MSKKIKPFSFVPEGTQNNMIRLIEALRTIEEDDLAGILEEMDLKTWLDIAGATEDVKKEISPSNVLLGFFIHFKLEILTDKLKGNEINRIYRQLKKSGL